LETVRDAIHHLQTDISSIKDSMTVIAKFLHEPLHLPDIMPTPCDNFVSNHWDEWSAGLNLQANSWGSGLNVHAVDFIPAHEQAWVPLSRDALLAFRHTVPEESERSDLKLCASARAYCHPRGYADENEACTIADDELSLACSARNHVPSSKQDFIKHDSATWLELKAEAANVIQTWWRGITFKPCGPAATGTEWFGDRYEMILPISGCTDVARRGISYPLKLQRSEFMSYLPANPHLIEVIDTAMEMGSIYRTNHSWQELPLSSTDKATTVPAWLQCPVAWNFVEEEDAAARGVPEPSQAAVERWSNEQALAWLAEIIDEFLMADDSEKGNLLQNRWLQGQYHIDAELHEPLKTLILQKTGIDLQPSSHQRPSEAAGDQPGVADSTGATPSRSDAEYWDKERMLAFIQKLILILQKKSSVQRRGEHVRETWSLCQRFIAPDMQEIYRNTLEALPQEVTYNAE